MGRAVPCVHVLLYVVSTALQVATLSLYRTADTTVFLVLLGLVLIPSVITNAVSLIWTYRVMDFSERRTGEAVCVIMHLLQLGLFWRFMKVIAVNDNKDAKEIDILRLTQTCLQDGPFIILQAYLLSLTEMWNSVYVASLILTFISLTFTFACISSHNNQEASEKERRKRAWLCCLFTLSHVFLLVARFSAIVVFTIKLQLYTLILLAIHWAGHTITNLILLSLEHSGRTTSARIARQFINSLAGLYNVASINYRTWSWLVYYVFILVENLAMTMIWFVGTPRAQDQVLFLTGVLVCYMLGIGFLLLIMRLASSYPCASCACANAKPIEYRESAIISKDCHASIEQENTVDFSTNRTVASDSKDIEKDNISTNVNRIFDDRKPSSRSLKSLNLQQLYGLDENDNCEKVPNTRKASFKSTVSFDMEIPAIEKTVLTTKANIEIPLKRESVSCSDSGILSTAGNTDCTGSLRSSTTRKVPIGNTQELHMIDAELRRAFSRLCADSAPTKKNAWDLDISADADLKCLLDTETSTKKVLNKRSLTKPLTPSSIPSIDLSLDQSVDLSSSGCYADISTESSASSAPASTLTALDDKNKANKDIFYTDSSTHLFGDIILKDVTDTICHKKSEQRGKRKSDSKYTKTKRNQLLVSENPMFSQNQRDLDKLRDVISFSHTSEYSSGTSLHSSMTSSSEGTCSTCRDSYRRRHCITPTSCTSDTYGTLDMFGSDFEYMTWPPRRINIVNITDLPKEKITLQESISRWLNQLPDDLGNHHQPLSPPAPPPNVQRSYSLNHIGKRTQTSDYMQQFLIKRSNKRKPLQGANVLKKIVSAARTPTLERRTRNTSTSVQSAKPFKQVVNVDEKDRRKQGRLGFDSIV